MSPKAARFIGASRTPNKTTRSTQVKKPHLEKEQKIKVVNLWAPKMLYEVDEESTRQKQSWEKGPGVHGYRVLHMLRCAEEVDSLGQKEEAACGCAAL